ncbi:hypothetical protein BO94DRAFT_626525 [Aspergillus sclerotioniger CBS 115572]|uniref:Uncharacterized protein n=1 Tax=Aspergillus sclerotioniger CBS 115572 TaxID=1450535 RepID=A0A317VW04_9EURO|nr:hypothetical protein BO94DRAFT_626525 [Aspergillus sclerotioniger CBS 115572]PWY78493.1 hypothetical protein BO94DRAFT_626525 [Aspergillus sclerotioniger CBS 115572]
MSSGNKQTSKSSNGMGSSLSAGNLSQVPDGSSGSMERFAQSSPADGPYYARARMGDRSEHVSRLSSQLDAADQILKK